MAFCVKKNPHSLVVHVRVVLLLNSQIVSNSQIRVFVIKEVWCLLPFCFLVFFL
jgi:TRAP-type mannitol/chloroaromatic compound transport system permease small subunit